MMMFKKALLCILSIIALLSSSAYVIDLPEKTCLRSLLLTNGTSAGNRIAYRVYNNRSVVDPYPEEPNLLRLFMDHYDDRRVFLGNPRDRGFNRNADTISQRYRLLCSRVMMLVGYA